MVICTAVAWKGYGTVLMFTQVSIPNSALIDKRFVCESESLNANHSLIQNNFVPSQSSEQIHSIVSNS